jgi:hypothetical protein
LTIHFENVLLLFVSGFAFGSNSNFSGFPCTL